MQHLSHIEVFVCLKMLLIWTRLKFNVRVKLDLAPKTFVLKNSNALVPVRGAFKNIARKKENANKQHLPVFLHCFQLFLIEGPYLEILVFYEAL